MGSLPSVRRERDPSRRLAHGEELIAAAQGRFHELAHRESEQVKWKENVADVDDVVATLSAFANDSTEPRGRIRGVRREGGRRARLPEARPDRADRRAPEGD